MVACTPKQLGVATMRHYMVDHCGGGYLVLAHAVDAQRVFFKETGTERTPHAVVATLGCCASALVMLLGIVLGCVRVVALWSVLRWSQWHGLVVAWDRAYGDLGDGACRATTCFVCPYLVASERLA